jgi:hypothetical protein
MKHSPVSPNSHRIAEAPVAIKKRVGGKVGKRVTRAQVVEVVEPTAVLAAPKPEEVKKLVLEELGLSSADIEDVRKMMLVGLGEVERNQVLKERDQALTRFLDKAASVLGHINTLMHNHRGIINEAVGLGILLKRNNTKAKLGQQITKEDTELSAEEPKVDSNPMRDHKNRNMRNPRNKDKEPLKATLAERFAARGEMPSPEIQDSK